MRQKVLVVDDSRLNRRLLSEILEEAGFDSDEAGNGQEALDRARSDTPDLILMDIMMPGMDGFEACGLMKEDPVLHEIPVIMVTAKTEGADIKRALDLGAFDYIRKPIDEDEVIARVQSALRYRRQQELLREMATKDSLTGLYNHRMIMELFEKALSRQERAGQGIAFVMTDVDHFKAINDTYGHQAGDAVLRQLAKVLVESVRDGDLVGRYGGEEFAIVLSDLSRDDTTGLCERIRAAVEEREFQTDRGTVRATLSVGACWMVPARDSGTRPFITKADEALYRAKDLGRNRVELFG